MKTDSVLPLPTTTIAVPPLEEEEGGLNLGEFLRSLRRKWWVIAGITVVTTVAAGVKVATDVPVYSSRFEILVQARSTDTEVISNVPETLTAREKVAVDADLLKILVSPKVLEPVIVSLRENHPEICPPAPAGNDLLDIAYDPCYKRIADRLSVAQAGKESDIVSVDFADLQPQTIQTVLGLVSKAYLDYSLSSKQVDVQKGLEFVEKKLPDLRDKVDSLQNQLQSLRLQHDLIDPESRGGQLASQVGSFSQQQLELEVQLKQVRSVYSDLQQQLAGGQEQAASSALNENPRYQTLLNTLLEIDSQIAEASTLYLDTSPDMQVLKEQRQNLLSLLEQQGQQSQRETINRMRELEAREQALQQTLQTLNSNVNELSGISRQYSDIQRELGIATENLNQFLAKREALEIDAAQREIPWEIVTPPSNPSPQVESLPQNLILGAALGLLLGVGVALLLDKSAAVMYSDEEIKRSTRLPILGRIPAYKLSNGAEQETMLVGSVQALGSSIRNGMSSQAAGSNAELNGSSRQTLVEEREGKQAYANDPFSEAFRSLYTNLRFLDAEGPLRSIVVGSVMAGEGKSTVAIYLAEAAAAMGKRVLLVDTDLRNPQLHNYLELSNTKGLTNLFSGEANPAVIQKFSSEPNMYVITAGSVPFDPARLLSSRSMKKFADQVKAKFDLVIYDTPPLLGQSDAYLVANYTDGMLLVTQPGKLKQPLLDRAMEQLRIADIKVLGLVTRES